MSACVQATRTSAHALERSSTTASPPCAQTGATCHEWSTFFRYETLAFGLAETYAHFATNLSRIIIRKRVSADTGSLTNALGSQTDKVRHPRYITKAGVRECVAQKSCADRNWDDKEPKEQVYFRPDMGE
jgi:hypothetical protein